MLVRARSALRRVRHGPSVEATHPDLPASFHAVRDRVVPYTMTTVERMYALYEAAGHIARNQIGGSVVECGVWRGGSSMVAALALLETGDLRDLWLYDTFEGMPEPADIDRNMLGVSAADVLATSERAPGASTMWAWATLDDVQANMRRTGYPDERLRYVVGKVEDTIPAEAPDRIALLRLDTDGTNRPATSSSICGRGSRPAAFSSSTTTGTGRAPVAQWTSSSTRSPSVRCCTAWITPGVSR